MDKEKLSEIKEQFEGLEMLMNPEGADASTSIFQLLELPEDDFEIMSAGVLQGFQQSINNPGDRIGLVEAINGLGYKAEDFIAAFMELNDVIDQLNYSAQKKDFLKQFFGSITTAISETEGIAKRLIQVPIELCHEEAKIPQYSTIHDAGADVYAIEDITIHPGETKIIPTGIKLALPVGYAVLVHPRSGLSARTKMRIANSIGLCDAGYRDEYKILIENIEPPIKNIDYSFNEDGSINIKSILHGSDMHISKGERIAQLRLVEVPKMAFYKVDSVAEIGENRGGGIGHTGNF